jgi:hypothetical protein
MSVSKFVELAIGPATGAALAAVLAWLVGTGISARWSVWQRRRESALSAVAEFCRLYGEFFSIWKLWNYSLREHTKPPDGARWDLLERAASAEAGVEALLVRLTCEARLVAREVEIAGKFRQAYQQLREAIRDGTELDWYKHDLPEYLAFKRLAASFALLVSTMDRRGRPSEAQAATALVDITSNRWEGIWNQAVKDTSE